MLVFLENFTHIEDLPGEIWFELFSYFDGQSLVDSFSQLNSSLQSFLNDYRLLIHLNISSRNDPIPSLFNINQIISLTLNYSQVKSDEIIDLNSFKRLRSLNLLFINDYQLEKTSEFQLNYLDQIKIQSKSARFITKIISMYFPHVRRMKLNSMEREFLIKSFEHNPSENQIKILILDGTIKLAKLFRLWSFVRSHIHSSLIKKKPISFRFQIFVHFPFQLVEFINVIIGSMNVIYLLENSQSIFVIYISIFMMMI